MSEIAKSKVTSMNTMQSPDNLLAIAVEKGADIDQLTKLMDLKERYEAANAKKAFYAAMSKFQSMVPTIKKTSQVSFNTTAYKFAPLGSIAEQIRDSMKDCGLSYRFEQKLDKGIEITCVVTHIDGHSEKTTITAEADKSGGKNSIQAIGSTVTYLQRYTLIGGLGLTTADDDIDAQVAISTGNTLDINQINLVEGACKAQNRDLNKLLNWVGVSRTKDIPVKSWPKICSALGMEGQ